MLLGLRSLFEGSPGPTPTEHVACDGPPIRKKRKQEERPLSSHYNLYEDLARISERNQDDLEALLIILSQL